MGCNLVNIYINLLYEYVSNYIFIHICVQVRARYEKVLEEVTRYAPRYMEEMESIFDQSQEEERKRISFLKQAFLSIHRHLDVTNNDRCVRRVVLKISISVLLTISELNKISLSLLV